MRVRKNHLLPPHLNEQARERCQELIRDAQSLHMDKVWVSAQLSAEFDAKCSHIVDACLREMSVSLE